MSDPDTKRGWGIFELSFLHQTNLIVNWGDCQVRRLCAVQLMEKMCFENLRLAFEHCIVTVMAEPRRAVAAEEDYEVRTIAALQATQVRPFSYCLVFLMFAPYGMPRYRYRC